MADLMTHVLIAYIAAKLLSLWMPWITTPYVTAAMLGAVLPDLDRIELLIPASTVEHVLGVPFDWAALGLGGPVAIGVLILGVLVPEEHRLRVLAMATLGAGLHLSADLFSGNGPGPADALLWPLSAWEPVLPGWYMSYDVRLAAIAILVAAVTWFVVEERRAAGTSVE